jgi:hypothetical protein
MGNAISYCWANFSWPYMLALVVLIVILVIYFVTKLISVLIVICVFVGIGVIVFVYWYLGSNKEIGNKAPSGPPVRGISTLLLSSSFLLIFHFKGTNNTTQPKAAIKNKGKKNYRALEGMSLQPQKPKLPQIPLLIIITRTIIT